MDADGLFQPLSLGAIEIPNRIVMAPMTRGRAGADGSPTEAMAKYYGDRADAGLLITEGVCVSSSALGWNGAPALYSEAHRSGWEQVTDAVRSRGGRIYAQLWYLGRVSHPCFLKGATPWAPSAIAPRHHVYSPAGEKLDCVTPHAMSPQDIKTVINEFAAAARLARAAGFDGIQIHGANGYLPDQFLRDGTNHRFDGYGGSARNRARFIGELVEACCAAIGPDRVSIRLSPRNRYNDIDDSDPVTTFGTAAELLSGFGLAFLDVMEGLPGHFLHVEGEPLLPIIRQNFAGVLVANGGYDAVSGDTAIGNGEADAIAFGIPFLANPDFVTRLRLGAALNPPDPETFYSPGAPGYLTYPTLSEGTPSGVFKSPSLSEASRH